MIPVDCNFQTERTSSKKKIITFVLNVYRNELTAKSHRRLFVWKKTVFES